MEFEKDIVSCVTALVIARMMRGGHDEWVSSGPARTIYGTGMAGG